MKSKTPYSCQICIEKLSIKSVIGVYLEERLEPQQLFISLMIQLKHSKSAESDVLSDTLDYGALSMAIKSLAKEKSYQLIERLAADIFDLVINHKTVSSLALTLYKPSALKDAEMVSVTLESNS